MVADDLPGEGAMTALHPNQIWLLRIRGLITVVTMVLPIIVLDLALRDQHLLPAGLAPGLFALTGLIALILLPKRRYRGWAYREGEDELHIRHGLLMRVQTVVPFGRVQHIDVHQGPIERAYGLGTLVLHTAGNHNHSVALPGLGHADAMAMREEIRAHVKRETM